MKTLEYNHGGNWLDRLLNAWPLCIDADSVDSWAVTWDAEGVYYPEDYSLFYNGFVFVRLCWPLGIWLHVKPVADRRFQVGFGWKLNGRAGLILRWQTDASAAKGTHGPNVGQAHGWKRGTA